MPQTDETERSRVAPVSHELREASDDFSADIKKLLAGLEPKIASEAIARAETLGKLPASQQTLLRCALSAASETFKKAESVQDELARLKAHQRQAEADLLVESQASCRRSALAEAQVAGLREDLAAQVAANDARESRYRRHRRYLWLALAAMVSAGIVWAILLSRPPLPPATAAVNGPQPDSFGSEVIPHRTGKSSTPAHPNPDPVVEQTLDRLDGALARVPVVELDGVLGEANQWLLAARNPPCFLRVAGGEMSVLVTAKGKRPRSLLASLARCAEAVEHVAE